MDKYIYDLDAYIRAYSYHVYVICQIDTPEKILDG